MAKSTKMNHLKGESSPYLQQHVKNPVDWYPWSEKALEKARRQDKPILLSIGYTACHWCHVMAHESFEDEETATLMNQLFINIKVDREERPDLDKIYQTAHALLTQRGGGWPLTVFLTPQDLMPFFSGTYFPKDPRYNLPAFKYVLRNIADLYHNHKQDIIAQNIELEKVLSYEPITDNTKIKLTYQPIELAKETLALSYDDKYGGFGTAPKFPQPTILNFLLETHRPHHHSKDDTFLAKKETIVSNTLRHMAEGGLYDQLEGGFFRYSVDAAWRIPHFEKMLYDNAQLLSVYAKASTTYHNPLFTNVAMTTAKWVLKNLQDKSGGFYSSLDADSEDQEGKYYVWNKYEIQQKLLPQEYAVVNSYYGLESPPNFETFWHLSIAKPIDTVASELKLSHAEVSTLLKSANKKLITIRHKRILPDFDKKILTAWNALMIKALFTAGDLLNESDLIKAANKALSFLYHNVWKKNRLMANFKDNQARFPGYLDDYAFLLSAVITALQIKWSTQYSLFAINLAEALLKFFEDQNNGGFFFTSKTHEKLIQRPKSMTDESLPSGNGIAAQALLILGYLLGETRYLDAAQKTLVVSWDMLSRYPVEHCSLLSALNDFLKPPSLIIIRGPGHDIKLWHELAKKHPKYLTFAIPNDITELPGLLSNHQLSKKPSATICEGTVCREIIHDFDQFHKILFN